ncbi:MAG: hypothetical protein OHK0022_08710 [Roseiflexaceae bacterium]
MWIKATLQQLGIPFAESDIDDLEQWSGEKLHTIQFFDSLEDSTKRLTSRVPMAFLPIAVSGGTLIGLHLSLDNVAARKPAISELQGGGAERSQCIEKAPSLRAYLHAFLLEIEDDDATEQVNAKYGADFFDLDSYTEPAKYTKPSRWEAYIHDLSNTRFGSSPYHVYQLARSFTRQDPSTAITILQEGIAEAPRCLHLYDRLVRIFTEQGDIDQAARTFNQSLAADHYTAYLTNLDQYYQQGRDLLKQVPSVFTPAAVEELETIEPTARFRRIAERDERREFAEALKLLDDWCFDQQDYNWTETLTFLRWHYERLGLDWAVQLSQLRTANPQPEPRLNAAGAAWEEMVRRVFKIET